MPHGAEHQLLVRRGSASSVPDRVRVGRLCGTLPGSYGRNDPSERADCTFPGHPSELTASSPCLPALLPNIRKPTPNTWRASSGPSNSDTSAASPTARDHGHGTAAQSFDHTLSETPTSSSVIKCLTRIVTKLPSASYFLENFEDSEMTLLTEHGLEPLANTHLVDCVHNLLIFKTGCRWIVVADGDWAFYKVLAAQDGQLLASLHQGHDESKWEKLPD